MKLCAVQIEPIKGDIDKNIVRHQQLIQLAVDNGADTIIFPELSITGYEPTLAASLAMSAEDDRLHVFQTISDEKQVIIGVGIPTKQGESVCISMALFHPNTKRQVYSKQYLHADEEPFFISGQNGLTVVRDHPSMALSICYELSVPQHATNAATNGATVYINSSAKTTNGVDKAIERLSAIAQQHHLYVLFANCLGENDGVICDGRSAAWNQEGKLLMQLDNQREGVLIVDIDTNAATTHYLK